MAGGGKRKRNFNDPEHRNRVANGYPLASGEDLLSASTSAKITNEIGRGIHKLSFLAVLFKYNLHPIKFTCLSVQLTF